MIALFHQNPVTGEQGGVERYLSTLAHHGPTQCLLVLGTDGTTRIAENTVHVRMRGSKKLPSWLRYVLGVVYDRRFVQIALRDAQVGVIEFSRPELLVLAPFFFAKKVVTMHGTGPNLSDRAKYFIHHAASVLLPLTVKRVHVVGRDSSGIKPWLFKLIRDKVQYIDAWCDDVFTASAPPATPPYRVFYAGRLANQKNPDLLAQVIRTAKARYGTHIEFLYIGNDFSELQARGCRELVSDFGLKTAEQLSLIINTCHVGILCSGFGEGSPFIIAETLSCGRAFVVPPLHTIQETYADHPGVIFSGDWTVDAYLTALESAFALIKDEGAYIKIRERMIPQQASRAVPRLLDSLNQLGVSG